MQLLAVVTLSLIIGNFSSTSKPDWVEVVNTSENEINFSDYLLVDSADNKLENDLVIPAKGNCVMDFSNRLNNGGDIIILKNKDGTQVDCVKYGEPESGECSNSRAPTETKPTNTCFAPTPTPDPTVVPTVFLTPKPKPSPTITPQPTSQIQETEKPQVLSAKQVMAEAPKASSTPDSEELAEETIDYQKTENKNLGIFSMVLGGVISLACGALIVKKEYNKI